MSPTLHSEKGSAAGRQLVVASLFDNPAVLEDIDNVAVAYRVETVSDCY